MNISQTFKEMLIAFSKPYSIQPIPHKQSMLELTSFVTGKSYELSYETYGEIKNILDAIASEDFIIHPNHDEEYNQLLSH
jgi:hypothetical protein